MIPAAARKIREARREGRELADEFRRRGRPLDPRRGSARDLRARARKLEGGFREHLRSLTESGARPSLPRQAAAWILDNEYVIEGALDTILESLTPGLCRRLPLLPEQSGNGPASTRADLIARHWVDAVQGRLELEELRHFIRGFQEREPLSLAELWALPVMLRLALLEWLDREVQETTGKQVAGGRIGSGVVSLRVAGNQDWREFVEELSIVESLLREDPAGLHRGMDFRTRDRYRHAVEDIAHATGRSEPEVARTAIELASQAVSGERSHHVGAWLIGRQAEELIRTLGARPSIRTSPARRRALLGIAYPCCIVALALAGLLALGAGLAPGAALLLLGLAFIPILGISVSLTNWAVGRVVRPRALPRMDFRQGIPPEAATAVAVPTMLASPEAIREVVHTLEVNYLANPDPAVTFVLLSDFPDAPSERLPEDEHLLETARREIDRLNARYGREGAGGPFVLLHRGRRWNEAEGCWMGWERKRGKLSQFNALLLGSPSELWVAAGDRERLRQIPFVITLDQDTLLPRGAAQRLVGTHAHPLNRPRLGPDRGVEEGYTVLQPRLEILPDPGGDTPFFRIFGGMRGLDLYAHAAFDVYQDLYDEGIFAGKGIYDVAAFEASLHGRVPENSILSHDLFEGSHGRAGYVADVIVLEDFPAHPLAWLRRSHRWIRGDWQLLPWLGRHVPLPGGRRGRNPLGLLARWQVLDNLRRSLQPPALLLLLVLSWTLYPEMAGAVGALAALTLGLPVFFSLLDALVRAMRTPPTRGDLGSEARALWRAAGRGLLELAFLPAEARSNLDAIVRTLNRVHRTRRGLLEWTTAAAVARSLGSRPSLVRITRDMWAGPVLALGLGALALLSPGDSFPAWVAAILLLWLASPALAQLSAVERRPLPEPDEGTFPPVEARLLARRTWGFFERFQGPETNWLPPDNFQEDPRGILAERTSPTNIGMALVSSLTAWDLGFVGSPHLIARIGNTLSTMGRLHRHRGHLLNWYDTRTLAPLSPLYVSTVDSGNLAASLLVVRGALEELRSHGPRPGVRARGVHDTIRVLREVARESGNGAPGSGIHSALARLEDWSTASLAPGGLDLESWSDCLETLQDRFLPELSAHLLRATTRQGSSSGASGEPTAAWLGHLRAEVEQARFEVSLFAPWLGLSANEEANEGLVRSILEPAPALKDLPARLREAERALGDADGPLSTALARSRASAELIARDLDLVEAELDRWVGEMEFGFLYDSRRRLFRIGLSLSDGELDRNHYDLLASEARIASAVAMARGDVPLEHYLHLGRPFVEAAGGPVLLSWSGTMFEYVMPTLFLRTPPESLLHAAVSQAIRVQRRHGEKVKRPWGVSESGYHLLDHQGHYQYRAFGISDLALRRETEPRHVVAPYASLMAVAWAPAAVEKNLERLRALGGMGPWGPYEALDFGRTRESDDGPAVVRSYMSHHHGMILAALGNYLSGDLHVERMHRDPRMGTVEPFLHERIPWRRGTQEVRLSTPAPRTPAFDEEAFTPWQPAADRLPPPVHLLSNGRYALHLGPSGAGSSRWGEWSLVRGHPGPGRAPGGPHLRVLDEEGGSPWGPFPEPGDEADEARITFFPHGAEYLGRARGLRAHMRVSVAPQDDIEIRTLRFVNEGGETRRLRLALWQEIALAPPGDDLRHPAFHKLFVRVRPLTGAEGLLFERRPRGADEDPPALGITLRSETSKTARVVGWESDRMAFFGRGGSRDAPRALTRPSAPATLSEPWHPIDPIAAAIVELELPAFGEARLTLVLGAGREAAEVERSLVDLATSRRANWLVVHARSRAEGELLELGAEPAELPLWEELLSHTLYPRGVRRVGLAPAGGDDLSMPRLWRWGISGDFPIVHLRIRNPDDPELLVSLLRAQAFWRARGLTVDLVVEDEGGGGYEDPVRDLVRGVLHEPHAPDLGGRGGVHIVPTRELAAEEREVLRLLATVSLDQGRGDLARNLEELRAGARVFPPATPAPALPRPGEREPELEPLPTLSEPSAHGGFEADSGEYLVELGPGEVTPAPWANVVARDEIGFLVTEAGGGFTWAGDAGEFRLTPWSNDPVLDLPGEVVYLRDEESGELWSPSPRPLGRRRAHRVRHGWGGSRLEAGSPGLLEVVEWSLHPAEPVKVVRVRLENRGERTRRIQIAFFADWVLGTHRQATNAHILSRYDPALRAIIARNPFVEGFAGRLAFLTTDRAPDGASVDREEFLGRPGRLDRRPAGLEPGRFSEGARSQGEACGALQTQLVIAPGAVEEVCFFLGVADDRDELVERLARVRSDAPAPPPAPRVSRPEWTRLLERVRVRTPNQALDRMVNGWLPYQTLSSRIRGRTGFYQSGGAFGFRDQLQDAYTMLHLDPGLARRQLEEAAARQFEEGDVLHWWHPGTTRGVRTRCSDDLLWLPFVLCGTVRWTGDLELLERRVPFLRGEPLGEGTDERYQAFEQSTEEGTLWEHACRAVELAWGRRGARGLPLIGTGDWNDGMDRVGRDGRGESIWMAWFMGTVLRAMSEVAVRRGETGFAREFEERMNALFAAVEATGWDGDWYRRAFFDNGAPLGSRLAPEARIDSIAQSWSVLSGGADPARAARALESAWERLVDRESGLSLLLTPPFDGHGPHPGYIATYPPGVRENGGQYTHAAAWLMSAFARTGDGARAGQLLEQILPVRHAEGAEGTARYRVEPYVVAADIYGTHPHTGRGGWTWYTGSAGWIYRVTLEDILGLRREGDRLLLDPTIPPDWPGFEVEWVIEGRRVEIRVDNPDGVSRGIRTCRVDGRDVDPGAIPLPTEGAAAIRVVLGASGRTPEGEAG